MNKALILFVFLLMGCSHNAKPLGKPLPTLTYAHLSPVAVQGGHVRVQQSFRFDPANEETLARFAVKPDIALQNYARQRFVQSGGRNTLVFDIQNASISKLSDEENLVGFLSGQAEDVFMLNVLIHMTPVRLDGQRAAPFQVTYKKRLSLPQNISVAQREFRQFEMIEKAIAAIDGEIINRSGGQARYALLIAQVGKPATRYFFQKAGMNKTSTVNSSKRPRSIPMHISHFAASGSGSNVPVGPMISPKPGPTLDIEVTAPDMAVKKSNPMKDKAIANKLKPRA